MDDQVKVEVLRARLDEDVRIAQAAGKGGLDWPDAENEMRSPMLVHARHHDPARVLSEVAAKRKLLALATAMLETFPADEAARLLLHQSAEEILRQLAEPYADQGGRES